ncbi:hypothetical protein BOTBODRAFT_179834 [Botryobasidium botryosum FD-172 SS1]|uniref:Uncharacterized protein n=1 Tax=Botryobasidium botryosum (strain FD-172 SS1) TaxID=930990 RepID=A0A067MA58_BOTB1|nr:hypothetical protein BOTBODRAFT_182534 [Botryobasidium botryosum FD-172 SS1]KDQ08481.1 hypothetical protein BOTBODRAFT_179834 [Botryobasidium botryosum FD-172 SS1]
MGRPNIYGVPFLWPNLGGYRVVFSDTLHVAKTEKFAWSQLGSLVALVHALYRSRNYPSMYILDPINEQPSWAIRADDQTYVIHNTHKNTYRDKPRRFHEGKLLVKAHADGHIPGLGKYGCVASSEIIETIISSI